MARTVCEDSVIPRGCVELGDLGSDDVELALMGVRVLQHQLPLSVARRLGVLHLEPNSRGATMRLTHGLRPRVSLVADSIVVLVGRLIRIVGNES